MYISDYINIHININYIHMCKISISDQCPNDPNSNRFELGKAVTLLVHIYICIQPLLCGSVF